MALAACQYCPCASRSHPSVYHNQAFYTLARAARLRAIKNVESAHVPTAAAAIARLVEDGALDAISSVVLGFGPCVSFIVSSAIFQLTQQSQPKKETHTPAHNMYMQRGWPP